MSKLIKRILSCLIIAVMLNIPVSANEPVGKDFVLDEEIIYKSYEIGLVTEEMTEICLEELDRKNAAKILYRLYYILSEEKEKEFETIFRDTDLKEANAAYQLGLMDGYSKIIFGPSIKVTREEFAKYLYSTVNAAGIDLDLDFYYDDFIDIENISSEYKEAVFYLSGANIIDDSDEKFRPKDHITIEHAAVMAFNAYEFFIEKEIFINGKSISIGDSSKELVSEFGEPDKTYISEYNSERYVYFLDKGYLFAGINEEDKIEEIFTNSKDFRYHGAVSEMDIFEFKEENPDITYKHTIKDNYTYTNIYFDAQSFGADGIYIRANHLKKHVMKMDEFYNSVIKESLTDMVNVKRKMNGLKEYSLCNHAGEIAARQSGYMSLKSCVTHDYIGGESLSERLSKSGVKFLKVSENISCTMESAVDIFYYWISIPGMRNNIYSDEFESIGTGCFINRNLIYSVMVFYG